MRIRLETNLGRVLAARIVKGLGRVLELDFADMARSSFVRNGAREGSPGFFRNGARVGGRALTREERSGSAWSCWQLGWIGRLRSGFV
ncbi:hypothetical protein GBA52_024886 [Prunus armeniaca]|nr:hypothetical protein GBA52_024886 [Prunus armeniaca]